MVQSDWDTIVVLDTPPGQHVVSLTAYGTFGEWDTANLVVTTQDRSGNVTQVWGQVMVNP